MNLKSRAISGVKWTTASTVITTLLQIAQLAILARLLSPSAFGLMALTMIVIGFSQTFLDMGIGNAVIHKQKVSHDQLSTLYWINIGAGLTLYGIVNMFAPYLAEIYKEPELTALIGIVGLSFVIQPFGQQFMILWQKEMRFSEIAKIVVLNKGVSLVVSVYMAYRGYGVYALAYGALAGVVIQTALFIYFGLKEHKPSFVFKINAVREFLSFGLYQTGDKSINYLSANIDKILIGKFIGMEALGFYNLAWQLIIFPLAKINPIVNRVAFPLYAKVQNNRIKLSHYYGQSIKALTLITIPILTYSVLYSSEIVYLLYGDGWELSATLLSILAVVGMLKAISNPGGSLLLALGRADVGFWWNIIWAISISIVIYVTISLSSNIVAVSYSLLVASIFFTFAWHRIIYKLSEVEYKSILKHLIKILTLSAMIGALSLLGVDLLGVTNALSRIMFSCIFCLCLYGVYIVKFEKAVLGNFSNKEAI